LLQAPLPQAQRMLQLDWEERGGPPVTADPGRGGFGRRLLERGLAHQSGARVQLEFRPSGLRCQIAMPLGPNRRDPAHEAQLPEGAALETVRSSWRGPVTRCPRPAADNAAEAPDRRALASRLPRHHHAVDRRGAARQAEAQASGRAAAASARPSGSRQ
jgi:hypothetical protein